jgi:hypothetical protein
MAAIAALTLTDAAGTPVNHTYIPMDCTSQLASWAETASGIAIGMPKATMQLAENGDNFKLTVKLVTPVLETITGDAGGYTPTPKVAYELLGKAELILPKRSSLQQRKDLKAMFIDLMGDAVVTAAVQSFEKPF